MKKSTVQLISRIQELGFTFEEAMKLRRIEMTLQRWAEAECGDSNDYCSRAIERDETTDKPFMVVRYHNENKARRYPIADREKGALKRLAKIMANHPSFIAYHQGDCRGCMLYIVHKPGIVEPVGDNTPEAYTNALSAWADRNYTRGLAICD